MLRFMCLAIVFGLCCTDSVMSGTGFNLSAKGSKNFSISYKVGAVKAMFSSRAPLENIDGNAASVVGNFVIDPANLEISNGKISIPIASIETGIELRNKHLREKDWLDAETNPNIVVEIKKLSAVTLVSSGGGKGVARATAEGTFSVRGISKPLTAPIEITYMEKKPSDIVMITTEFKVSLKDYNIPGRKNLIGSKVSEVITVKATLYGATG